MNEKPNMPAGEPTVTLLDAPALSGWRASAIFTCKAGRFGHALEMVREESRLPLLTACDQTGIATPVYQELHQQPDGEQGSLLFLTGMADNRYWSTSVAPLHDDRGAGLEFDTACRTQANDNRCGVVYGIAAEAQATNGEQGAIRLTLPGAADCELRAVPIDGAVSCRLRLEGEKLLITPCAESSSHAAPLRWAYSLAVFNS